MASEGRESAAGTIESNETAERVRKMRARFDEFRGRL